MHAGMKRSRSPSPTISQDGVLLVEHPNEKRSRWVLTEKERLLNEASEKANEIYKARAKKFMEDMGLRRPEKVRVDRPPYYKTNKGFPLPSDPDSKGGHISEVRLRRRALAKVAPDIPPRYKTLDELPECYKPVLNLQGIYGVCKCCGKAGFKCKRYYCRTCGQSSDHWTAMCPKVFLRFCEICGVRGEHWASMCPLKKTPRRDYTAAEEAAAMEDVKNMRFCAVCGESGNHLASTCPLLEARAPGDRAAAAYLATGLEM